MSFDQNLEFGVEFEHVVAAPWLRQAFPDHWITETRNHRHTEKGPRMVRGAEEIILPDFRLDHNHPGTDHFWVDAKRKSKPFRLGMDWFLTIDTWKYKAYNTVIKAFPTYGFYILYGTDSDQKLRMLDLTVAVPKWHLFDNAFSKGASPCFKLDDMIVVGDFDVGGL